MTTMGRSFGVTVVLAFLVASAGCKQILALHERAEALDGGEASGSGGTSGAMPEGGGHDANPTGPVAGMCGALVHTTQACADCMDTSCCEEANGCHDDTSCGLAFGCIGNCGDDGACRARCTQFYNRADALIKVNA